ncbi:hypothetical protein [Aquirhabdus sp.]|uniref:hypothetical protein n=1 Tax=Aquirhabdus sp. TaxID=2824160 RepID=UPI00396CAD91
MARARNIKPSFFFNDELIELCFAARLLFIGLWTLADREGYLEDRPKKIKMSLFPADSIDVDALLDDLTAAGFLERYTAEGAKYIHICKFDKHQNPHYKEAQSVIPKPILVEQTYSCAQPQTSLRQAPGLSESNPADSLIPDSLNLIPDSLIPDPFNWIPDSPNDDWTAQAVPSEIQDDWYAEDDQEVFLIEGHAQDSWLPYSNATGAGTERCGMQTVDDPVQGSQAHASLVHIDPPRAPQTPAPVAADHALNIPFETFWDLYDKKVQPKACARKWQRLTDAEREQIMQHVQQYKLAQPDKAFRKNPETYLNQKAWLDEIVVRQVSTQPARRTAQSAWDQYFAEQSAVPYAESGSATLIDVTPQHWGGIEGMRYV